MHFLPLNVTQRGSPQRESKFLSLNRVTICRKLLKILSLDRKIAFFLRVATDRCFNFPSVRLMGFGWQPLEKIRFRIDVSLSFSFSLLLLPSPPLFPRPSLLRQVCRHWCGKIRFRNLRATCALIDSLSTRPHGLSGGALGELRGHLEPSWGGPGASWRHVGGHVKPS